MSGIVKSDLSFLYMETLDGNSKIFKEVVDYFIENTPPDLEKLKLSIEEKDFNEVTQVSHYMKSSGVTIGAMKFTELCDEIEQLGRSETFSNLNELYTQLNEEFALCIEDLKSELFKIEEFEENKNNKKVA